MRNCPNDIFNEHFTKIVARAGLRGATGAIAPSPLLEEGPRDDNYFFEIKYSFEKLSRCRSDTRIQVCIPMLHLGFY